MRSRAPGPMVVCLAAGLLAGAGAGCRAPRHPELAAALEEARLAVGGPGAIVGVRHADGKTELEADGLADLASGEPMRVDDAFFLGSVSKIYTAALVLRLAETATLSLADPLSRFLPDFPRADEITVRHLLAHTSGLKDFYLYLYLRPDRGEMIRQVTRSWRPWRPLHRAHRRSLVPATGGRHRGALPQPRLRRPAPGARPDRRRGFAVQ